MFSAAAKLSPQSRAALRSAWRRFAPALRMSTAAWAERYRRLASGAVPGPFRLDGQPSVAGILAAFDDPRVRELVGQKSAQYGWTQGVILNIIGRIIHIAPCAMLILFPKADSAKRFMREKLEPTIAATPELASRINVSSRKPDSTGDYKKFIGGFIQLVGTNSPANVKSTDAPLVIVEEPDDTSKDVQGQGDSVALGRERIKSFPTGKMAGGGTPTLDGFSKVQSWMEKSDKRRYFVACPAPQCNHLQTLRWEQVTWLKDALVSHPIYGTHRPETARYACEACGLLWTDSVKNAAVRVAAQRPDMGWQAQAPFTGIAGFYINDLMSVFHGVRFELMARKFLEADHALRHGDDSLMRSFRNNQLGEVWKIKSDAPEVETLRERAGTYAEWTCPAGGLVATAFVDVQRGGEHSEPRLEYLILASGRDEEAWVCAIGKLLGNPLEPLVWAAMDAILAKPIRNAGGGILRVSSYGVDSGDGMTSDAVYSFVRPRKHFGAMATKGSGNPHREIFSAPSQSIDTTQLDKAAKYGLRPYMIGIERAKDLIAGRLKLTGVGPGRIHWFAGIGEEFYKHLTSEVKMPGRGGRPTWTKLEGRNNEMLDCLVGAIHAFKRLRPHNFTERDWQQLEEHIRQPGDLIDIEAPAKGSPRVQVAIAPAAPPPNLRETDGGFGSDAWSGRL